MENVKNLEAACKELKFNSLRWDAVRKTHVDVKVSCDCFIRDGALLVTSDDGRGIIDYYGEFRGGYPYIDPQLEAFAEAQGCFWEWNDPASISLYEK